MSNSYKRYSDSKLIDNVNMTIKLGDYKIHKFILPNAVTRATCDTLDPQVLGARANGDAIITCFDGGVHYCNISWKLNMDAVCVWTVGGGYNFYSFNMHILAAVEYNMVHLTI